MIEVASAGARTSIERPFGTPGHAHEGVSRGGACDSRAALAANRAAGGDDEALVLEVVLAGPKLRFRADAVVAIAGAPFAVKLDGDDVRDLTVPTGALVVRAGQTLSIGSCPRGLRCAVAVRGGFRGESGSVLARGAVLEVGDLGGLAPKRAARLVPGLALPWALPNDIVLRMTPGPQSAILEDARLFSTTWIVDPASDRSGVRMRPDGAPLKARAFEMITAGVTAGAVQLPPAGAPIVLGVDRATTGGYPVVAHVASVDLWLLGQLRPGAPVRFASVSFDEARALLLAERIA